jgi:hypothetical protein
MSTTYQIVVCGSIVPDPLQTLALGVCSQLTKINYEIEGYSGDFMATKAEHLVET